MGSSRSNRPLNGVIMPVRLTPPRGEQQPHETLNVSQQDGTVQIDHEVTGTNSWERISVTRDAWATSVTLDQGDRQIDVRQLPNGLTRGDVVRPGRNGVDVNDIVDERGSITSWVDESGMVKKVPTPTAQANEDRALLSGALRAGKDELAKDTKSLANGGQIQTRVRPPKPF